MARPKPQLENQSCQDAQPKRPLIFEHRFARTGLCSNLSRTAGHCSCVGAPVCYRTWIRISGCAQRATLLLLSFTKSALNTAFNFVDSYLAQASEGIFVGVGIVFLLWTMISLLSNVEASFNQIWRVRQGRTMIRKITDYLAILLVLPVLMICGSGLSLLMSTTLKDLLPFSWSSTAITMLLDCASYVITWIFLPLLTCLFQMPKSSR